MHATKILLNALLLSFILSAQVIAQPQDPTLVQQQTLQRLDLVVEQRRQQGNTPASIAELRMIGTELENNYQFFLDSGNLAPAALSAIRLGQVHRSLQNWALAKAAAQSGYDLAVRASNVGYQVNAQVELAKIELYQIGTPDYQADYHAVAKYVDQAMSLAAKSGDKARLCEALQLRAELQIATQQFIAAADSINRSRPLAAELNNGNFLFWASFNEAEIYVQIAAHCDFDRDLQLCNDALNRAQKNYEEAKAIGRKYGYNAFAALVEEGFLTSLGLRGVLHRSKKESIELFTSSQLFHPKNATDVNVSQMFVTPEADSATPVVNERSKPPLGEQTEAFALMENSRSQAMADLLQNQDVRVRPEDQKLYADYLKVTASLSLAQQKVFRDRAEPDSVEKRQGIASTEKEIQALETETQNLRTRMGANNSTLLGLLTPQTATLPELQQSIKQEGFEVLYYRVTDAEVIIWHINGDQIHVVSVFLPRVQLIDKVNLLGQSLKNPPKDLAAPFDDQLAGEMFLFLVQPVLKWIKTNHLVIIPHEDLNYLRFESFYDPESKKYLAESFQVSYAPSATVLLRLKKLRGIRGGNLLAVDSSALDEGKNEVQALGRLYPRHSKIVVNRRLEESAVKSWLGGYDLIHLSVHGRFRQDEPLLSYLAFSPGGVDDGKLSTAEMFGLPLNKARLVVLSACETGEAKETRANEIVGMQRALLYAGANNLILSSWKVDAAATELWMTTFYREAQTKPFSEASQLASMAVKNKYRHPYYWSPFVLIGK